jgi:hypothetical protein
MPRLTPEEAARIAMQYDAVVPEDIEVEVVPSGAGSAWGLNMTRREAVDRARRVYQRLRRFKVAERKASKR